jgi:hypothetical protein
MWDPREDSYIQELAARIEALEAAQQPQQLDQSLAPPIGVKPQWLVDEQRLGDLEAAIKRREDRGVPVPLDWVIEVCEIRDRQKERRKGRGLREKVDLIVQVKEHGQQPPPAPAQRTAETRSFKLPNQEAQHEPILKGTRYESTAMPPAPPAPAGVQRRYPSPATIAECGGPCDSQGPEACDCGLLQELNHPSPAPAGELVKRVAHLLAMRFSESRPSADCTPFACDVLREVAKWLDGQIEIGAAHMLRQEADL